MSHEMRTPLNGIIGGAVQVEPCVESTLSVVSARET